jgi:hypothetical protein
MVSSEADHVGRQKSNRRRFLPRNPQGAQNVHPGVWSRDRSDPLKFTKGVYGVVDEGIEVANSWLLHRVEKNLMKAMKKEEKKNSKADAPAAP